MNNYQKYKIIDKLLESQDVDRGDLLSIVNDDEKEISDLNSELKNLSAAIIKEKYSKYELIIINRESFNNYYENLKIRSGFYNTQNDRITHILKELLINTECVKIEELSEELYVSQRQISNYLKTIRSFLINYNLQLKTIPHYGLMIIGDEFVKRSCLVDTLSKNISAYGYTAYDENERNTIISIRKVLEDIFKDNAYRVDDYVFESIIINLYSCVVRIQHGASIICDPVDCSKEDIEISNQIVEKLSEKLNIVFDENEKNYVLAFLVSKRNYCKEDYDVTVPSEINNYVVEVINRIDNAFNKNFKSDFKLCMSLALHFIPLINRVRFGFKQVNPMLSDIKQKYLFEFEMAEEGLRVINEHFNCRVSDDEIAYIALDLRMSEENRYSETKMNVLMVCSAGRGNSELLKMQILRSFNEKIAKLDLCYYIEINNYDLDSYDYILTTVPLHVNTRTPIFHISHYLDNEDKDRLYSFLHFGDFEESVMRYYSYDLFMGVIDVKTKEEAIGMMTRHIEKYQDVPDGFYEAIMEREKVAHTCYANNVAFPHPRELMTDNTFVCVAVTKEPIVWDGNDEVSLILLASIEKNKNKDLNHFYRSITKIICSEEYINELIKNPKYEVLENILVGKQ